jgi:hypothetical protein
MKEEEQEEKKTKIPLKSWKKMRIKRQSGTIIISIDFIASRAKLLASDDS